MAARERDTYSGSVEAVADVFMKYCVDSPTICTYKCEEDLMKNAALIRGDEGIEGNLSLINDLHALQDNLAFNKSTIRDAVKHVWKVKTAGDKKAKKAKQPASWASKMTKGMFEEWVQNIQLRVRCMCRVVGQGVLKNPDTDWVQLLPFMQVAEPDDEDVGEESGDDGEEPEEEGGEEEACEEEACEEDACEDEDDEVDEDEVEKLDLPMGVVMLGKRKIFTGWLSEVGLPFRMAEGTDLREPGLPIDLSAGADDDEVVGEWPDGSTLPIKGITVGMLRKHGAVKRGSVNPPMDWTSHEVSGHDLAVCQKIDRKLLMIVTEQNRQVLQVNVACFGELEKEKVRLPFGHVVMEKARAFMKDIMTDYAGNLFGRADLKHVRDERLAKLGLRARPVSVKKKPAAAPVSKRPAAACVADQDGKDATPGTGGGDAGAVRAPGADGGQGDVPAPGTCGDGACGVQVRGTGTGGGGAGEVQVPGTRGGGAGEVQAPSTSVGEVQAPGTGGGVAGEVQVPSTGTGGFEVQAPGAGVGEVQVPGTGGGALGDVQAPGTSTTIASRKRVTFEETATPPPFRETESPYKRHKRYRQPTDDLKDDSFFPVCRPHIPPFHPQEPGDQKDSASSSGQKAAPAKRTSPKKDRSAETLFDLSFSAPPEQDSWDMLASLLAE